MKCLSLLLLAVQCALTRGMKLKPGYGLGQSGTGRAVRFARVPTRGRSRSEGPPVVEPRGFSSSVKQNSLWRAARFSRTASGSAGGIEASVFSGDSESDVENPMQRWSDPEPMPPFGNSNDDASKRISFPDDETDEATAQQANAPLWEVFGYKLITIIVIGQWLIHGFVMAVVRTPIDFIFKDIHVSGDLMQLFDAVIDLPWQLKPVIGLTAELGLLSFRGYKKAPMFVGTSIFSVLALIFLWWVDIFNTPPRLIVLAMFLIMMQMSTVDLLVDAKCAEAMRDAPTRRADLISFKSFGTFFMTMMGKLYVGLSMSTISLESGYVILMPMAASCRKVTF